MRFLICSLSSSGFLFPSAGLAIELNRRGHSVLIVTEQRAAQILRDNQLEVTEAAGCFDTQYWAKPISIALQVKVLERAAQMFVPDVIVGQSLTIGPYVVAERQGIPIAVLGFVTYLWPAPDDLAGSSERSQRRMWRTNQIQQRLNEARTSFGLPAEASELVNTPLLGDLFMVRSVPALEPGIDALPQQVHLVGPCLWEPDSADTELSDFLSAPEGNLLYVNHGRFFDVRPFWPAVVGAYGETDLRVVASLERMDSPIGQVPSNFYVKPGVSQRRALSYALAMIATPNTSATLGALTHAVPSVLIPGGGEQPDVAEHCYAAGLCEVLQPEQVNVTRLRAAVESVVNNDAITARLRRIAAALNERSEFRHVADLLEHLAIARRPITRGEAACQMQLT